MNNQLFNISSRDALLKLNIGDQLFIMALQKNTLDEKNFFDKQYASCDLSFIVKIAHASKIFEELCNKDMYHSLWSTQFQLIGGYLTKDQTEPLVLFEHPDENSFNLLRGAYFFYRSQQELEKVKKDFSIEERLFLKEAVALHSIHATQRYNQYIFSQIESADLDVSEKFFLLDEARDNCKNVLQTYGSYAYIMLAEVYFRIALLTSDIGDKERACSAFNAALKACDFANKYIAASECSIHNASLGKGFQYSNSMLLATPDDIKEYINHRRNKDLDSISSFRI